MKGQYLLRHLPSFLDNHFRSANDRRKYSGDEKRNAGCGTAIALGDIWTNRYLLHALGWSVVYVFWILVFQKRSFVFSRTATIEFCYLIFIAANFYFNVYFGIPRFLYRRRYFQYAILFIGGVALAAALRVPLASYLSSHYFSIGQPQPAANDIFVASFINVFIWTSIIISVKLIYDHFRFEESMILIKKEKSNIELDLLNAQMNPHFLFNSLNMIYGEIDRHNSVARNMILSFSNMLRYQLYDCNHERIQIADELAYIKNYVGLQRARMAEDVDVILTIEEQLGNLNIAPLLFISFIENAFKYAGLSELYGNKIEVSFSRVRDNLLFRCFNTKDDVHPTEKTSGGIGVYNAKKRLALHYPNKHDLQIIDHDHYFLIELTIEVNEMEMHYSG